MALSDIGESHEDRHPIRDFCPCCCAGVDKRNDAGNDTGDSKVDALNAQQLNQNYQGQNPGDQMKR
jgi:hypothetical protein